MDLLTSINEIAYNEGGGPPVMWCNILGDSSHSLLVLHTMFGNGNPPVVYPFSNWSGLFRCFRGWCSSDWRSQLVWFYIVRLSVRHGVY